MLVRTSFVALSELDTEQLQTDRATGALAVAESALAREQLLIERSLVTGDTPLAPSGKPPIAATSSPASAGEELSRARYAELRLQTQLTRGRLEGAHAALALAEGSPSIDADQAEFEVIEKRLEASEDRAARVAAARMLEPLNRSLTSKLELLRDHRARQVADLELARETLRARLIGACGASIITAVTLSAAMIFFVLRPLRRTARGARRIGQGDLNQRIGWSVSDDLGIIATELNRMAIRLHDLRETESGRRQMEHQLTDAVVQSIFEPVIVHRRPWAAAQAQPGGARAAGRLRSRPHGADQHPGRRPDPHGDPRSHLDAAPAGAPAGPRGRERCGAAADSRRHLAARVSFADHTHARQRGPPAGRSERAGRCDRDAGPGPLQDAVSVDRLAEAARPPCRSCGSRCMPWRRAMRASCVRCRPTCLPGHRKRPSTWKT